MKLFFIGADHEVTGSCHMIEACGKHLFYEVIPSLVPALRAYRYPAGHSLLYFHIDVAVRLPVTT